MRPRLSYANVTSSLALFVAIGGVSYAAVTLPRDSVGAPQLRPSSVTQSKLGFALASRVVVPTRHGVVIPGFQCRTQGPTTIPPACAAPAAVLLATTAISVAHPANLLIIANANLGNPATNSDPAVVQLFGGIDGQSGVQLNGHDSFTVAPNTQTAGFYVGVLPRVSKGRHAIQVFATNVGPNAAADDISLAVVALPEH